MDQMLQYRFQMECHLCSHQDPVRRGKPRPFFLVLRRGVLVLLPLLLRLLHLPSRRLHHLSGLSHHLPLPFFDHQYPSRYRSTASSANTTEVAYTSRPYIGLPTTCSFWIAALHSRGLDEKGDRNHDEDLLRRGMTKAA